MPSHFTNTQQSPPVRSALTRNPFARLDGRSADARRICDLYRAIMARLGNPADPMVQADALALAELKVAGEAARLALLRGEDRDPDQLIRLENLTRRIERKLGFVKAAQPTTPRQSAVDRIAALAAQRTAHEAERATHAATQPGPKERTGNVAIVPAGGA